MIDIFWVFVFELGNAYNGYSYDDLRTMVMYNEHGLDPEMIFFANKLSHAFFCALHSLMPTCI